METAITTLREYINGFGYDLQDNALFEAEEGGDSYILDFVCIETGSVFSYGLINPKGLVRAMNEDSSQAYQKNISITVEV